MKRGKRRRPRFGTIVVDPPWPYASSKAIVGNGGRGKEGASRIIQVSVEDKYPTMSISKLSSLRVSRFAEMPSHLYLWVTNNFITDGFNLVRAWGFEPKSFLTWGKVKQQKYLEPSMKTGYYFRGATEHVIFAVRGSLRLTATKPTLLLHPRLPHSVKPDKFFSMVEECSPGPYLELFARRPREGWTVWGNEVESGINL